MVTPKTEQTHAPTNDGHPILRRIKPCLCLNSQPMKTKRKTAAPKSTAPKKAHLKLSASMASLLAQMATDGPKPQAMMRSLSLAGTAAEEAEPEVHVFVRCSKPLTKADAEALAVAGGAGTVRTALVPVSKVAKLAAHESISRVSAPRELKPLMDIARPTMQVPPFRQKTGLSGNGVIIGLVDSGVDVTHAAFGQRILKLWDQNIPGKGPGAGFPKLGAVLTGAAMAASKDTVGHGTHVAGIATGAVPPYDGIAPKADLIVVKTNFLNTGIAEGIRWIFSEAAARNRPAVINLSLGGHGDAHDGSDDLSTVIDQECGPGRLVVSAAGNEGTDRIHASLALAVGTVGSFPFQVASNSSGAGPGYVMLNGWYEGTGTCDVRLTSSTGVSTPWQPVLNTNPTAKNYKLVQDRASIATPPASVNPNGDHQFLITVQSLQSGGTVQGGNWLLEVRPASGAPGTAHVWLLLPPGARPQAAAFTGPAQSESYLIGSPGASSETVTVASYTTRNQWTDSSGAVRTVGLVLNSISDFSSPGPRRDGALKPDVAAPGAMIISCLSAASKPPASNIVAPGYRVDAGTSMATPMITGMLALLLEQNKNLTPAQAKAWLQQRAAIPGQAAGKHDAKWGYGLLRI